MKTNKSLKGLICNKLNKKIILELLKVRKRNSKLKNKLRDYLYILVVLYCWFFSPSFYKICLNWNQLLTLLLTKVNGDLIFDRKNYYEMWIIDYEKICHIL